MQRKHLRGIAFRTSLAYAVLAGLWIFFSSRFLILIIGNPQTIIQFEVYKGYVFVLVTSTLLYVALDRQLRRQEREAASRMQTEEALRRQEAHMQAMLLAAQDGFWLIDGLGRILEANAASCLILGYSREELLSMRVSDLEARESPADILDHLEKIRQRGAVRFETEFRRKDGRTILVEASVTHLKQSPDRFVASHRDITRQKQTQQALVEGEARFRALSENSLTGVFIVQDWKIRYVNSSAAKMFGYKQDELEGKPPLFLFDANEHGQIRDAVERRMVEESPTGNFEVRGKRKDGGELVLEILGARIQLDGKPAIIGNILDITERRKAEEEIRHLAAIVQSSDDAIIGKDLDGTILSWNRGAERIYGYSAQEAVGKSIAMLIPQGHQDELPGILEQVRRGVGIEHRETRRVTRYGRVIDVSLTVSPVHDARGDVIAASVVARDITDRKVAENALRESADRLRFALETNHIGTWEFRLTDHTAYRSPEHGRIFGYEELLEGWTFEKFLDHVLPEDRGGVEQKLRQAAASQTNFNFECRIRRTDGVVRWIWVAGRHRVSSDGSDSRMAGIVQDITERKNAQELLEKAQSILAEGQKISHTGTFEFIAATQTTVWSEEEYRIYGLDPAGPSPEYNKMLATCLPPEDAALLHQAFSAAIARRGNYELEHRIVRPDGSIRWVYDRARPYFDKDGDIVRYVGATLDITERKHAEEAIRLSQQRLSLAAGAAAMGIWDWDIPRNEMTWDDQMFRLYGIAERPDSYGVEIWANGLHPDDRARTWEASQAALRGECDFNDIFRVKHPDGTVRYLKANGLVVRDEHGQPVRMLGVNHDITEHMQAEEALRANEERLRAIVEGTPYLFFYTQDEQGNNTYVSPTVQRITGHTAEEWIRTRDWYTTDAAINDIARKRTHAHLRGEESGTATYIEVRHAAGHPIMLEVYEHPVMRGGHIIGLQGVAHDITERKRTEEQMTASLREKEILLKEVHHRVKNNLQVISSLLAIQANGLHDESAKAALRDGQQRVRTMAIVHERLYRTQNFANVNFDEYLKAVTDDLLRSFGRSGITCELDVDPIPLTLDAAIPCGLIVNELVTNALKHAFPEDRTGRICVSFHRPESSVVELRVSDDGIGLPTPRPSRGMGTELVDSLANQLEGKVLVQSVGGTSVTIRFPG